MAYLLSLAHGVDSLDVVAGVTGIMKTEGTDGHFADHAVHAERLVLVLHALEILGLAAGAETGTSGLRLQESVLCQGSTRRVTVVAARVTVEHLALLAQHRGVLARLVGTQLTLEREVA